jgi:hypothetical protein
VRQNAASHGLFSRYAAVGPKIAWDDGPVRWERRRNLVRADRLKAIAYRQVTSLEKRRTDAVRAALQRSTNAG